MDIIAWLTLAGILVALGIGVYSIHLTKDIQKRQYRHMRLREVISWALDIRECNTEVSLVILERQVDKGWEYPMAHQHVGDLPSRFEVLEARGEYISKIIYDFGQELQNAVEKTMKRLKTHADFMKGILSSWSPDGLKNNRTSLDNCVSEVIQEVTRLTSQL